MCNIWKITFSSDLRTVFGDLCLLTIHTQTYIQTCMWEDPGLQLLQGDSEIQQSLALPSNSHPYLRLEWQKRNYFTLRYLKHIFLRPEEAMFEELAKACLAGKCILFLRKLNIVQLNEYYQTEWETYIYNIRIA